MEVQVVLEALSALTGTTVNPLSKRNGGTTADLLTINNFLPTVYGVELWNLIPIVGQMSLMMKLLSLKSDSAVRKELFVDMEEFFHPEMDYDFRNSSDSSECSRGGEPYTRPWGWYRFALKVRNKYPGGNTWLGSGGWRDESSPGEWPVSFHGTSIEGARGIAGSSYKAGPREAYGRGIYSTPNIRVADDYTKEFTSKNGNTYKVIMQNRINPEKRKITVKKDFWLIEVPEKTSEDMGKKIVEESICPYGILIKEV